jgi:small nuclear ribonucleoprotein (snRNP)-like protein
MAQPQRPKNSISDALDRALETPVTVSIKGGRKFQGNLRGYDIYMNLVLDDAVQIEENRVAKRYGAMVIRGDNVVFVAPHIA